ncbi:MAG TPA: hypothetical protein VGO91_07780 [Pyrinomonadaceae bacterium]|jgi:hypothetical protein|nr:hypothetical protein [Pyrinomonadaceae bacterium]
MKRVQKHLLAATVLVIVGLGALLLDDVRRVAPLQTEVMDETSRAEATPSTSINSLEDKSKPASLESHENMTREKSMPVKIKQWGLNSWSRLRRKLRRLV